MKRVRRLRSTGPSIAEAMTDPMLFAPTLGDVKSWGTWRVAVKAAFSLPLNAAERQVFGMIAGGREPPAHPVRELWCVIGARGGKTRIASLLAAYVACLRPHKLAPGETGHVLAISPTRDQASLVNDYAREFIAGSPVLAPEIAGVTANEIRLKHHVTVSTHPCSFRSVRGRTLLAVVLDEVAFFRDETSANPDREIYRAVRPRLVKGGLLVGISTGYRRLGLLHDKHRDYFGVDDDDVLVVSGSTQQFNPTFDPTIIEKALQDDPAAASEWTGGFRADIGNFLDDADIEACIDTDRPIELPPRRNLRAEMFVDPSGGRHDHFAYGVGYRDGERVVIAALRGHAPPFDTKQVVAHVAALAREWDIGTVTGDNFAAAWVADAFKAEGLKYVRCPMPKGRLYVEGLPLVTRRIVSWPNHPRLLRELRLLERRTHAGGKDTVDHGRNGSDDYANVVFGLMQQAAHPHQRIAFGTLGGDVSWQFKPEGEGLWRRTDGDQGLYRVNANSTLQRLPEPGNPLSGSSGRNECIAGKAGPSDLTDALRAIEFNLKHGIPNRR